jgi:hypothetical protein
MNAGNSKPLISDYIKILHLVWEKALNSKRETVSGEIFTLIIICMGKC